MSEIQQIILMCFVLGIMVGAALGWIGRGLLYVKRGR